MDEKDLAIEIMKEGAKMALEKAHSWATEKLHSDCYARYKELMERTGRLGAAFLEFLESLDLHVQKNGRVTWYRNGEEEESRDTRLAATLDRAFDIIQETAPETFGRWRERREMRLKEQAEQERDDWNVGF